MPLPVIKERVRLKQDLPELGLKVGAVGIVRGVWPTPPIMFEIEFVDKGYGGRVLIPAHRVEQLTAA